MSGKEYLQKYCTRKAYHSYNKNKKTFPSRIISLKVWHGKLSSTGTQQSQGNTVANTVFSIGTVHIQNIIITVHRNSITMVSYGYTSKSSGCSYKLIGRGNRHTSRVFPPVWRRMWRFMWDGQGKESGQMGHWQRSGHWYGGRVSRAPISNFPHTGKVTTPVTLNLLGTAAMIPE